MDSIARGSPPPSLSNFTSGNDLDATSGRGPLMSSVLYEFVLVVQSFALLTVGLFGCISNAFVILTYRKIGFLDSINVSYVALAISDIGAVVTRAWGGLLFVFVVWKTDIPFNPNDLARITSFWYGNGFEKTTACITAYVALERCLCVLFPLHVKTMMTRKKTTAILITFFLLVFGVSTLAHVVYPVEWKFDETRNRSILGLALMSDPTRLTMRKFMFAYFGSFLYIVTLFPVWICTVILAFHLQRSGNNLRNSVQKPKKKETHVVKVVFAIAAAFLLFSTPTAIVLLVPIFVPGFSTRGTFYRTSLTLYQTTGLLSSLNSSTNFFIYIYAGSKFRETFLSLLGFEKK